MILLENYKQWNMKLTVIALVVGALGRICEELVKGLGNKRARRDNPNSKFIKIVQNTVESFGDLRRFAVTQAQVRNHQLTLVRKPLKLCEQ